MMSDHYVAGARRPMSMRPSSSSSRPPASPSHVRPAVASQRYATNMNPAGRAAGVHRPPSSPGAHAGSRPTSARDVDLNSSRLSQHSTASSAGSVTLGGRDYHVGSRVGTSGLFVIGDPAGTSSARSSRTDVNPSTVGSERELVVRGDHRFAFWNWPAIRCGCVVALVAVAVALLAVTIVLSVRRFSACDVRFPWWRGSLVYRVSLPAFADSDVSGVGDFDGALSKLIYMRHLGVRVVALQRFLPSTGDAWDEPTAFTDVDARLGRPQQFNSLVAKLHSQGIKVLVDWSVAHTSLEHPWFEESRRRVHPVDVNTDFYLWKDAPDTYLPGKWNFNIGRDQFYFYKKDINKPSLDWNKRIVQEAIIEAMEFWLRLGVDGFVMRDLDSMFVYNPSTLVSVVSHWREVLDTYSTGEAGRKVLMIESSYLNRTAVDRPDLLSALTSAVDLVEQPLGLRPAPSGLPPTPLAPPLRADVAAGLRWQRAGPWTVWRLVNMTLSPGQAAALQLVMLVLPGTPSLTAGQEVGKYGVGADELKPLLWKHGSIFPYSPSRTLNETQIEALSAVGQARNGSQSLRRDREDDDDDDDDTTRFNYRFLDDGEDDVLLLRRRFGNGDDVYVAANLGAKAVTRDWSDVTLMAVVVADTAGQLGPGSQLSLYRVKLAPGQAVVFTVTR